jgi:hypothetical protein
VIRAPVGFGTPGLPVGQRVSWAVADGGTVRLDAQPDNEEETK